MLVKSLPESDFLSTLHSLKTEIKNRYQIKVSTELSGVIPATSGELKIPAAGAWGQRKMDNADQLNLYALGKPGTARDLYYDKNAH